MYIDILMAKDRLWVNLTGVWEELEQKTGRDLTNECLLSLGCNGDRARIAIRSYIERTTPPAPPKPDWYVEPIREAQQVSA